MWHRMDSKGINAIDDLEKQNKKALEVKIELRDVSEEEN